MTFRDGRRRSRISSSNVFLRGSPLLSPLDFHPKMVRTQVPPFGDISALLIDSGSPFAFYLSVLSFSLDNSWVCTGDLDKRLKFGLPALSGRLQQSECYSAVLNIQGGLWHKVDMGLGHSSGD